MSGKDERPTVMPAGSMPPEQVADPAPEPDELLLGKFAGTEELTAGYSELEKKLGEQGTEVGSLKKMNQMLVDQLQTKSGQEAVAGAETETDDFDYDGQIKILAQAVKDGELPIDEALLKSNELTAEKATRAAMSQYEQLTQKRDMENTQKQFLDSNPDFLELKQTGALEAEKKTLPGLHDDFSAYYSLKAKDATAQAEAKKETDRIAEGDERTRKVLQTPSSQSTKQIGKGPARLSPGDLKRQTMSKLAALDANG